MSSTIIEPSTTRDGRPQVDSVLAGKLVRGQIVTNLGIIDGIHRAGVFVIASVRGTVWALGTGTGDVATIDVTWHEAQSVTVDVL